jgi:hypothetical protein
VEGKADETFGPAIAECLAAAERTAQQNPRSQAAVWVRTLCDAVFGMEAEPVGGLRYQLLHGIAGARASGRDAGAERAVFLVHEFRSAATNAENLARNTTDLEAAVRQFGGAPTVAALREGTLAGPFRVPGNAWIPSDIDLYIGKVGCDLS